MTGDHEVLERALARIEAQLAEQNKMIKALEDNSNFWFKPAKPGDKTRADDVVALTGAFKAGGLVGRGLLRTAGAIIVFMTLWASIKSMLIK